VPTPTPIKFGTDGWRAIIAEDYTFDNVRICAQSVADWLRDKGLADRGCVVGYDTRFASEDFAAATAEVLAGNGIQVLRSDRAIPTPVVSYTILDRNAGGGCVITSSHNPATWNGFKVKEAYAGSASPETVADLEARIARIELPDVKRLPVAQALAQGRLEDLDPRPPYLEQLRRLVDPDPIKNAGLGVVVDAMYGAGAGYFRTLIGGGRTEITEIRGERNPAFPGINPEPITQNLAALAEAVRVRGAKVGLATDGDADRLGVIDESGTFVNQLQTYALLALYLLEVRGLRGPLVKALTTTSMVYRLGEMFGVPVIETPVGFKYVAPEMIANNAIMGGEESGGYGFAGHIPERDGILAGLYFLDLMAKTGKSAAQLVTYLYSKVGPHYYNRVDRHFPAEQRAAILARLEQASPERIAGQPVRAADRLDGFRFTTTSGSWLLIRFSGTEPLMRIYAETTPDDLVPQFLEFGQQLTGV
jgi:alpha-D-glucose phosphate-specific phosphoglucomutase